MTEEEILEKEREIEEMKQRQKEKEAKKNETTEPKELIQMGKEQPHNVEIDKPEKQPNEEESTEEEPIEEVPKLPNIVLPKPQNQFEKSLLPKMLKVHDFIQSEDNTLTFLGNYDEGVNFLYETPWGEYVLNFSLSFIAGSRNSGAYTMMPGVADEIGHRNKQNLTQQVFFPYAVYQNGTITHRETGFGKITLYFSINDYAW